MIGASVFSMVNAVGAAAVSAVRQQRRRVRM